MKKHIYLFLILGVSLIFATGYVIKRNADQDHFQFYQSKFELLSSLRKSAIESYFTTVTNELLFWSESEQIKSATHDLQDGWLDIAGDPRERLQKSYIQDNPYSLGQRRRLTHMGDDSLYDDAHEIIHELGVELITQRGYYDFFLIDPLGNIIYTVEKESDYATNLMAGEYSGSGLAKVFRLAAQDISKKTHIADFTNYAPSNGDAALFMGHRINDEEGDFLGVVAAQLSTKKIMEIMQFGGGLGETGETYLVGKDGRMRSNSRFSEQATILSTVMPANLTERAFADEKGSLMGENYLGQKTLTAFDPIDIPGLDWAVLAEVSLAEIRDNNPVSNLSLLLGGLLASLAGLFGSILSIFVRTDSQQVSMDLLDDFDPREVT